VVHERFASRQSHSFRNAPAFRSMTSHQGEILRADPETGGEERGVEGHKAVHDLLDVGP
jgi:hypothetical protein